MTRAEVSSSCISSPCCGATRARRDGRGRRLREGPADDHPLDLVGALEDLHHLGLAHVALDREVAGVAVAAEHLHRVGGDLHGVVGGHHLGDRRLRAERQALVLEPGRGEVRRPGRPDRRGHVGEQEGEALVVDDLLAERLPRLGVGDGVVEGSLGQPGRDGGDAEPSRVQAGEGDLEAVPLGAEKPVRGDAGTLEPDGRGRRAGQAHLALRRVGEHALGVGRDQEAGDAVAVVGGPGHHLVEVRVTAVRDPRLGAVEHVVVAVAAGAGAHGGRVGPGVRLGEAVRTEQVAAEHVGEPALLLLLGAARDQAEAAQGVHRDPDPDAGPDPGELLQDLEVDLVGLATAAVLLGVGEPEDAGLAEHREHVARERLGGLGLGHPGVQLLVREVADQADQVGGLVGRHDTAGGHGDSSDRQMILTTRLQYASEYREPARG